MKTEIRQVRKGSEGSLNFYGQVEEFMKWRPNIEGDDMRHSVFICGSADSGKTYSCCWRIHFFALKYPGCQILMCRKSATALRNSAVKTYQKILKQSGYDKMVKLLGKSQPDQFIYPYSKITDKRDGKVYEGQSTIIIGNLDRSSDHLGAEYDMCYVNQPEEITLEDWEYLMSRTSGRKGTAPYSILFGDPNPAHEQHWIKKGFDEGRWNIFSPTHHDNPELYDNQKKEWTADGKRRIGVLENLSGFTKERLLYGKWVNTEGLVYGEAWDSKRHTMSAEEFGEVPSHWKKYVSIDWGYDHPFVAGLWAETPDGKLVRYKLIYRSFHDINENANLVKEMISGVENIKAIVCDRAPDQQRVMERVLERKISTARKGAGSRDASQELLTKRLKDDKILFIDVDDALIHERDPRLETKKKPTGFQEEVGNHRYHTRGDGTVIKEDDDEIDSAKYLIRHLDTGNRLIKILWL